MSAPCMARAPSVSAASSSISGTSGASSRTNCRSSSAVLAETRHSVSVGHTVFMASRCILACSPLPMNPITRASRGAKCLAASAPIAPTRMLEASVPSSTAIGNPFSISERMNRAVRFWSPNRGTLGGKTDTHFMPQTFSGSRVAGRQLIRSWVSWLKICTIVSGNITSPSRCASSADSAAPMAIRKSRQPGSSRSSWDRQVKRIAWLAWLMCSFLQECDRAAERRLATDELPREAAEVDAPVEHLVDLAAEVLDVDDVMGEQQSVHDLEVLPGEQLVQRAAQGGLGVLGLVGANLPDDGVHRVVGAAGVHGQPAHPAVQHPLGELAGRSRVAGEVAGLIDLAAVDPVVVVVVVGAGVDDEDVVALDAQPRLPLPALEVLGPVQLVVAESLPLQVDHHRRPDQPGQRQLADGPARRPEVHRPVQVRADVQGRGDLLPADLVEGQPLDPLDRRAVVAGEGRRVHAEVLRQVEHPHRLEPHGTSPFPLFAVRPGRSAPGWSASRLPVGERSRTGGDVRGRYALAIWIRLPQVSSNTAVVTVPISSGSWVNRTPRPRSRWNSACTSSTANEVTGIPSATSASLKGPAAGWASGSRASSGPWGSSGDTTVSQRASPRGMSLFFTNPRTSV